jgi:hypothetical protein
MRLSKQRAQAMDSLRALLQPGWHVDASTYLSRGSLPDEAAS